MSQSQWELPDRPPTDGELEAYFRNASNFQAGMYIKDIIKAMGMPDKYGDFDWGIGVYEWRRSHFRVNVWTKSGYLDEIDSVDPVIFEFYDKPLEKLWEHPTH